MFHLPNVHGDDDVAYLKALVAAVEKEQQDARRSAHYNKEATVQLVHEYQVNTRNKTVASVRYNTTELLPDNQHKCNSNIVKLIDGENYDFGPLNRLLVELAKHIAEHIDMGLMCGIAIQRDDIQAKARSSFTAALRSVGIYWEYDISAVVGPAGLDELIVTVC